MRRTIRSRRVRRRPLQDFELQLTSMMDVLVIILVFLLKTYTTSMHNFATLPGLKLPITDTQESPPESLQVLITPSGIHFENEEVAVFDSENHLNDSILEERGLKIRPLYDALIKAKEKSELLRAKSSARDTEGNPLPFEGTLAVQADKTIKYDVLRKVMYTAAVAGYQTYHFLAQRRDE